MKPQVIQFAWGFFLPAISPSIYENTNLAGPFSAMTSVQETMILLGRKGRAFASTPRAAPPECFRGQQPCGVPRSIATRGASCPGVGEELGRVRNKNYELRIGAR